MPRVAGIVGAGQQDVKRMRARPDLPSGEFTAEITDLTQDGRGVGRVDGRAVFIGGALPGEIVRFVYERVSRDYAEGRSVAVEHASADRVSPACAHFESCGGCSLQHLSVPAQRHYKQEQLLQALARIGRVSPEEIAAPLAADASGYRRRARLGVHCSGSGEVIVGFRQRESRTVTPLDRCLVLDPRVGQRIGALQALIAGLSIRRDIPQMEIACAGHVALVLRLQREPSAQDCEQLRAFSAREGFEILFQRGGADRLEALTPPMRSLSYSPMGDTDELQFRPGDFIQINAAVSRLAVRQALEWLAPQQGAQVLELFCGLGNFSVPLARAGARVTGVEGEAALLVRARDNAQRLGLEIRYERADLFKPEPKAPWLSGAVDLALLDPPRAGAQEVLPLLARKRPERILYVSCHPGSLARDAGRLVHEHGYQLQRAGILDMFPHTAHVESMALFVRARPQA